MGLKYLPLWKIKVTQNGVMNKNIHVYLTFHHGFEVFTIMENQGDTKWDYEKKHSCLFNIRSWFCSIYHYGKSK